MELQFLMDDLQKSQEERADLLQQKEQLEQQLEMVDTQIGHCEGGIIKVQQFVQRLKEQESAASLPGSPGKEDVEKPAKPSAPGKAKQKGEIMQ